MRRLAALGSALALLAASPAFAWNNQGHMATGALAYDALMRIDPGAVRRIVEIESANPDPRWTVALSGLKGSARDRVLFMEMARWPDDIRGGPLDHPDWHYAVHVVTPGWSLIPYTAGRSRQAFDDAVKTVEDPHASARDKAVALCWVMHLAGDMHQPLHAGHWLSGRFPKTDRAGTIGYVRTAPGAPPRSLHDAWDSAADLSGPELPAAARIAAGLEEVRFRPYRDPSLRTGYDAAMMSWTLESRSLAATDGYVGDALKETPSPAAAPLLSPTYQARARAVANARLRMAGLRTAALLDAIVGA